MFNNVIRTIIIFTILFGGMILLNHALLYFLGIRSPDLIFAAFGLSIGELSVGILLSSISLD